MTYTAATNPIRVGLLWHGPLTAAALRRAVRRLGAPPVVVRSKTPPADLRGLAFEEGPEITPGCVLLMCETNCDEDIAEQGRLFDNE